VNRTSGTANPRNIREPMENENMLKNINFPLDFVGENSAWIDELTG
jgi:hypothetical protein